MFVIRSIEEVTVRHAKPLPEPFGYNYSQAVVWIGKDSPSGGYPFASEYEFLAAHFPTAEEAFKYLDSSVDYIDHPIDKFGVYEIQYSKIERSEPEPTAVTHLDHIPEN